MILVIKMGWLLYLLSIFWNLFKMFLLLLRFLKKERKLLDSYRL